MKQGISIKELIPVVKEAGRIGLEGQKYAASSYKNDGTVLTEYDIKINDYLLSSIKKRYPDANVITEEAESKFKPGKSFTFAVDPIDGTDAFSQGMPGWAVSVGVLDENIEPAGGIIYAPKWGYPTGEGTFVFSNPGGEVYINNKLYEPILEDEENTDLFQIILNPYQKSFGIKISPKPNFY